ncbi:PRC-barrel domain-containing protein [Flaviaesturariibacter amylovorans]|uniref:PRC-barrel domain-containing protein n=1 Tax=Flaviaesturariibacter amylovorans TaxID=1084520 RepID=A0ABP8HGB6_9BACT
MASTKKRLVELRGSDFEMAKGQPNIMGWEVVDGSGHKLGKVHELVIDTTAQRVRYMVVALSDNKILQLEKRTVMVPIGFAQLHAADDCVVLHGVTPYQLRALPRYDKAHLGARSELDISNVFGRNFSAQGSHDADSDLGNTFYEHDHFNDKHYMQRPSHNSNSGQPPRAGDQQQQPVPRHSAEEVPASHQPYAQLPDDDPESIRRRHEQALRDEEELRRKGLL